MTSPWYTESITAPPLDHVPVTPTPRKYVLRGLKRGGIAAVTAAAAIGLKARPSIGWMPTLVTLPTTADGLRPSYKVTIADHRSETDIPPY